MRAAVRTIQWSIAKPDFSREIPDFSPNFFFGLKFRVLMFFCLGFLFFLLGIRFLRWSSEVLCDTSPATSRTILWFSKNYDASRHRQQPRPYYGTAGAPSMWRVALHSPDSTIYLRGSRTTNTGPAWTILWSSKGSCDGEQGPARVVTAGTILLLFILTSVLFFLTPRHNTQPVVRHRLHPLGHKTPHAGAETGCQHAERPPPPSPPRYNHHYHLLSCSSRRLGGKTRSPLLFSLLWPR